MNTRCYIIDDDEHAIDVLKRYITQTPGLELAGETTNPTTGLHYLLQAESEVNIVFLDIDMPQLSGIHLANLLKNRYSIIFTTGFAEYVDEALAHDPVDFLLKPISYERFFKAVQKAGNARTEKNQHPEYFFLPLDRKNKLVRIAFDDLIYIEAFDHYIHFHTEKEVYKSIFRIGDAVSHLPETMFMRIQRSFIINLNHIVSVDGNMIRMVNKASLPVGEQYKEAFKKAIHNRIFGKGNL